MFKLKIIIFIAIYSTVILRVETKESKAITEKISQVEPNSPNTTMQSIFINATKTINSTIQTTNEPILRDLNKLKPQTKANQQNAKKSITRSALQNAAAKGLQKMIKLYDVKEPEIFKKGLFLEIDSPGARLAMFNAPFNGTDYKVRAAYAALEAAKILKKTVDLDFVGVSRQAPPTRVSLKRTLLEGLCPPRNMPTCLPASRRYRTHDGTCNNSRRPRWGSAQMPYNRFLHPHYSDGIEAVRRSTVGGALPSARFVSLLVHGARDGEAPVTMMLAQWGQFIDHDLTAAAQPGSINGTIPRCCNNQDIHPSCLPIKVPSDDPWLGPLGLRCLEFLRSAPAQRLDCLLSWREQTNQVTSYLDASSIYSSNARSSDNARIFRNGLLLFGRGIPREDVCLRGALANQCIRAGDGRSGEQPGLLAMHTAWVGEHNRIATELSDLNLHWSDEKIYQEARRIVGAMVQHITYREFLPLVLGKDVCKLFDLELEERGFYPRYDHRVNPTVANSFGAAAFRFGHSLVQGSFMRCDRNHRPLDNQVNLHDEFSKGDTGGPGSLYRLLRGLSNQRALKRDEFITPELTNHLFQTGNFPFGLDLAAINIQRGRDHGIPSYTSWRVPCGLTEINNWSDLVKVVGPRSVERIRQAYITVDDIDLFVGGLAERPVINGLVGPTFACIIAQQFSNLRKGDRFWYENPGFESSFTPAQLQSIRQVTLSQVICRTLGGGTLQPNIFLPPNLSGNNRKLCGVGIMQPIDLLPWTERDPFDKHGDFIKSQFSEPETNFHSSNPFTSFQNKPTGISIDYEDNDQSANGVVDKLDFDIMTGKESIKKTGQKVNNKLDFGSNVQTTLRPQTEKLNGPTRTKVNNKLDIKQKTTKLPLANFTSNKLDLAKRRPQKNTNVTTKTTTKRPTTATTKHTIEINNNKLKKKRKKPNKNNFVLQNEARAMDDENEPTEHAEQRHLSSKNSSVQKRISFRKVFANQDNATGYFDNTAIVHIKRNNDDLEQENTDYDYSEQGKRIIITTSAPDTYDIQISIRQKKPTLTGFLNDRSNIYNQDHLDSKTPSVNYLPTYTNDDYVDTYSTRRPPTYHPLTTYSPTYNDYKKPTPFSYDTTTKRQSIWNYDKRPNTVSYSPPFSNAYHSSPSYISHSNPLHSYNERTTTKTKLQTFLIIETTKRTTPVPIYTTSRPYNDYNSYRPNSYVTDYESHNDAPTNYFTTNYDNYDNYNYEHYPNTRTQEVRTISETQLDKSIETENRSDQQTENKDKQSFRTINDMDFYTDDYDFNTETPILNDDYNMNMNVNKKLQFDIDGYIRPDMIQYNRTILKKLFSFNSDQTSFEQQTNQQNGELVNVDDKLDAPFNGSIPRAPNFDILSADYVDRNTETVTLKTEENKPETVVLVPINVVTKPERPDDWIMLDAPPKEPLPSMPSIENDLISNEIPTPIQKHFRRKIPGHN